jgi:hypothetical protein
VKDQQVRRIASKISLALFEFKFPDVTASTNLPQFPLQLMTIPGHLNPAHEDCPKFDYGHPIVLLSYGSELGGSQLVADD